MEIIRTKIVNVISNQEITKEVLEAYLNFYGENEVIFTKGGIKSVKYSKKDINNEIAVNEILNYLNK